MLHDLIQYLMKCIYFQASFDIDNNAFVLQNLTFLR
jgi:hypothetical protein